MPGGLRVELDVPLGWRPLRENERSVVLQRAGIVLHLLNLQDAHPPAEEAPGELRRLEQKLDVVIAMLGLLLAEPAMNEPAQRVWLDPHGLCWQTREPPEPDSTVLVTLTLPGAPALALPAVARDAEAGRACARFDRLPAAVSEQLEKWIFRQHRLAVARSRAEHT